jgi:hypothetical protein
MRRLARGGDSGDRLHKADREQLECRPAEVKRPAFPQIGTRARATRAKNSDVPRDFFAHQLTAVEPCREERKISRCRETFPHRLVKSGVFRPDATGPLRA